MSGEYFEVDTDGRLIRVTKDNETGVATTQFATEQSE
jgi:hypothetical protein